MKATSKIISVVLILVLCLGLFPASAFATEGQADTQTALGTPIIKTEEAGNDDDEPSVGYTGEGYVPEDGEGEGEGDDDDDVDQSGSGSSEIVTIVATETVEATTASALSDALNDLTVKEVDLKATDENGGVITTSGLKANHTVVLNIGSCTLKFVGGTGIGAAIVADPGTTLTLTGSGKIVVPYKTESAVAATEEAQTEVGEGSENATVASVSGYTMAFSGTVRHNGPSVQMINLPTELPTDENLLGADAKVESGSFNFAVNETNLDENAEFVTEQKEAVGGEAAGGEVTGGEEAAITVEGETENNPEEAKPAVKFVIKQKEVTPVEESGDPKSDEGGEGDPKPSESGEGDPKPVVENEGDPKPVAENEGDPKPVVENEGDPKPVVENEGDPKPAAENDGNPNPGGNEGDGNSNPPADNNAETNPPAGADTVDETPVNVTETKETELKEKVEVSAEQQAAKEAASVTIQGEDPVTGTIVIITGVNLPEGLTVVVKPIDGEISGLEEGEEVALAVDITVLDKDGNVYEPWQDPNVAAVDVQIRNKDLGNLEEGEALTLYHVVNNVPTQVKSAEKVDGESAMTFSTDSFSPFVIIKGGYPGAITTGSEGDVHKRSIKIKTSTGSDIYIKSSANPLQFLVYGGVAPSAISIVDPDYANSGDESIYKSGILTYGDPPTYDYKFIGYDPTTTVVPPDPLTVEINPNAIAGAPEGKWAFVFWFKDETNTAITPVYLIQPVTILNDVVMKGVGYNYDEDENTFYAEKCDYDGVQVFLSAALKKFQITKDGVLYASYDKEINSKKISIRDDKGNYKDYNISEYFDVGDYVTEDPVTHEFVGGKTLKIYDSLLKKLPYGDNYVLHVWQGNKTEPKYELDDITFKIELTPGIAVADGLVDYIKGKNVWIKFIACEPIDYDADGTLAIWIGGQKISHDYYSISNDHKTLWIYRNLLDQLKSNNSYTLTARLWKWQGNEKVTWYPAQASFNILAAGSTSYRSPKTGDESNIALWIAVLVLSGGAVIALVPKKKKNK